jgi:adenosylcobinamide-GDP ribazoletransferase
LGIAWAAYQWAGLAAVAISLALTWGVARFTLRRIPGLTGDIYGATNELVEAAVLLVFVAIQAGGSLNGGISWAS